MIVHELAARLGFALAPVVPDPAAPAAPAPCTRRQRSRRAADAERARVARHDESFLATLAHELRTPLHSLCLARTLLGRATHFSSVEQGALAVIDRELGHLARLVDDLLDVSRITHGKLGMRMAALRLEEVVAGAVQSMRAFADLAGVHFEVEFDSAELRVEGDADRLSQVFANLLHNAVKYSTRGGVVEIRARAAGLQQACVSVRDHGAGIAPEFLGGVFELFAQDEGEHATRHGGLGIGLSLVRSLVGLHGGSVKVASAGLGTGSEFVVTLPRAAEASRLDAMPSGPRLVGPVVED